MAETVGIPKLLDPEDIYNQTDKLSIITQMSLWKTKLSGGTFGFGKKAAAPPKEKDEKIKPAAQQKSLLSAGSQGKAAASASSHGHGHHGAYTALLVALLSDACGEQSAHLSRHRQQACRRACGYAYGSPVAQRAGLFVALPHQRRDHSFAWPWPQVRGPVHDPLCTFFTCHRPQCAPTCHSCRRQLTERYCSRQSRRVFTVPQACREPHGGLS